MYNLTDNQKTLLRWFVEQVKEGNLDEDFVVYWVNSIDKQEPDAAFPDFRGNQEELAEISITQGALDALQANELMRSGSSFGKHGRETHRRCTLTGKAYDAVETNFSAPDTSFITIPV